MYNSRATVSVLRLSRYLVRTAVTEVVSRVLWLLDERRVSDVAVTCHTMFDVPSVLVDTVDMDEETQRLAVTVELRRQTVVDNVALLLRQFLLDRLSHIMFSTLRTS